MKSIEVDVRDIVKMSKVIVGIADAYDNEETVKGCYDFNDVFKAQVKDLYIKSCMSACEKNVMCRISRDIRDARIAEIMDMRKAEEDDDEE